MAAVMMRVFLMVLGNTMKSHEFFMERLKSKVKLREVFSVNDCDVIIAFVPIVSRAGTDIQAALEKIPRRPNTSIILVSLHHTFDPYYISPDSRHSVFRNDVFAVDCLYHEDEGLLNSMYNDKALKQVIKHLGGEMPSNKTSGSHATVDFNDHFQSSIPKHKKGFNNHELIPWIVSELIIIIAWSILPEGYSSINFFLIENIVMIIVAVIQNYYNLNKSTFYVFAMANIVLILHFVNQRITTNKR